MRAYYNTDRGLIDQILSQARRVFRISIYKEYYPANSTMAKSLAEADYNSKLYDVEALKRRDPAELDKLVRAESARVFRCIARLISDLDEAQSLTQETFYQALKNFDSFRGESKVSTWLCAIGVNLARAHLRKSKRVESIGEREFDQLIPSYNFLGLRSGSQLSPLGQMEQKEKINMLHKAIDRLPEDYKTVVTLRDLEELSTEETAEILDISEGAVRVRLHRARQALVALLR